MRVIGISGSLRKGSFNSAALRAAQQLAPEGMTIERVEIGDFPPEVMIGQAAGRFDEAGNLMDSTSRELIGKLLAALAKIAARR